MLASPSTYLDRFRAVVHFQGEFIFLTFVRHVDSVAIVNRPTRSLPSATRLGLSVAVGLLVGTAGALVSIAPAHAHVEVAPSTTVAGAQAVVELSFIHGCDGAATTGLAIRIPEGVEYVAPTRKAGWEITVDESSITYSTQDPVPDGQREVFELALRIPDTQGGALVLPTIQKCGSSETAWVEVPTEGQDADGLKFPAPSFAITPAAGATSTAASAASGHAHGAQSTALAETATTDAGLYILAFASLGTAVLATALAAVALRLHRRRP